VTAEVQSEVERRLDVIEPEHQVRVLYACESGSRAWGFASQDSDYDVRFLYLRRRDWYLSVDLDWRPDVIESPIDGPWDVNGWDLRKALQLFRKSNPPLLEWLQSPILYRERSSVAGRLRGLLPRYYSPRASMFHYLHMAQRNFREFLKGDRVWRKKYFYVLRPILACRWIESGHGVVPMEFEKLVDATHLSATVHDSIAKLLADKRSGAELDYGPRIPALSQFLEAELERRERSGVAEEKPDVPFKPLNTLFLQALDDVWS
jgi:predicted nucleotidyltransferase